MATALLGTKRFRLDPTKVTWSYEIRTSERETLGGKVVQIFGAEISDITIEGSFGRGGWKEQAEWLAYLIGAGEAQAAGSLPPIRFAYPNLGLDKQVYIKSFRQPEGSSVTLANEIPAPRWVITLVPLETEHGLTELKDASILGYMKRLSEGVGWQQTEYNGPKDAADLLRLIGSNNLEGARLFYAQRNEPVAAAALKAIAAQLAAQAAANAANPAPAIPAGGAGPGAPGAVAQSGTPGAATHALDWGPGWPACRGGEMATTSGGGITITVHGRLVKLVGALLAKTVALGYPLHQDQTGGYVCRSIKTTGGADTGKPSNHSRGTAIDLNWNQNGFGAGTHHDIPSNVVALWKAYGFNWGGDWVSPKDWMHMEFAGSPTDADSQTVNIAKS